MAEDLGPSCRKGYGRTGIISLAPGESRSSLELCLIGCLFGGRDRSR